MVNTGSQLTPVTNNKASTNLFVSEDEKDGLAQLVLVEHAVQLIPRSVHTVPIVRVHHEDKPLRVLVIVPPQRPDLVLPSNIPNYTGHGKNDATPI